MVVALFRLRVRRRFVSIYEEKDMRPFVYLSCCYYRPLFCIHAYIYTIHSSWWTFWFCAHFLGYIYTCTHIRVWYASIFFVRNITFPLLWTWSVKKKKRFYIVHLNGCDVDVRFRFCWEVGGGFKVDANYRWSAPTFLRETWTSPPK